MNEKTVKELAEDHICPAIAKLADMAKVCNQVAHSQSAVHFTQSVQNLTNSLHNLESIKAMVKENTPPAVAAPLSAPTAGAPAKKVG